jgi:hypothetical protein
MSWKIIWNYKTIIKDFEKHIKDTKEQNRKLIRKI